nr:prephenate dehydrogenase/arogenate dehydrogenase family protein [uncultured Stomatobaculum sp.]
MTYGFIGLGLIGGSIAKALKAGEPDCQIYAYMPSREMLEEARADGTVDRILTGTEPCLADCDAVFLCAPVETNSSYLTALRDILTADTLITDVGSSKQSIEREVLRLGLGAQFVGGHPMAGSEKSGYIYSDALLLENIFYLLCPTAETRPEMLKRMEALVHRMLANPYVIDAATHDRAVATISHLPHLIAAALVNLVKDTDNEAHTMRSLAAGGFKDITRIASSSPIMWQQIFSANRDAVLTVLDRYMDALAGIRTALRDDNMQAIHELFLKSGQFRDQFSDAAGLLSAQYSFSVHVADKPGAISIIAAILAAGNVNVKNIGINHNRESGDGALRIEFYDADSCQKAAALLNGYGFELEMNR